MQELEQQTGILQSQISALKSVAKEIDDKLENNLLKQIEILTVFVVIISLIITNVLGIDALSNYGLRGMIILNTAYVISVLFLLLGIKIIILGFKKHS